MKRILKINIHTADLIEKLSAAEFKAQVKDSGFDDRDELDEFLLGDEVIFYTKNHLYINVIEKSEYPF